MNNENPPSIWNFWEDCKIKYSIQLIGLSLSDGALYARMGISRSERAGKTFERIIERFESDEMRQAASSSWISVSFIFTNLFKTGNSKFNWNSWMHDFLKGLLNLVFSRPYLSSSLQISFSGCTLKEVPKHWIIDKICIFDEEFRSTEWRRQVK